MSAHKWRPQRIRGALRALTEDLSDYVEFKRAYVDMDSPEAAELGQQWGEFKRRLNASSRFCGDPKAYRAWKRLTHNGRRFNGVCPYCGTHETLEEREELDVLWKAPLTLAPPPAPPPAPSVSLAPAAGAFGAEAVVLVVLPWVATDAAVVTHRSPGCRRQDQEPETTTEIDRTSNASHEQCKDGSQGDPDLQRLRL